MKNHLFHVPSQICHISVLVLLFLGVAWSPGISQHFEAMHPHTEQLNDALQALRQDRSIPGMAVAVSHKNKMIFSKGFGHINLEQDLPATDQTMFRLASVSKLLTIACVAKLMQDGKLDIHVPIESYIKDYPHAGKGITTKLLCGHLGGIRHYKAKDLLSNARHFESTDEALKTFVDDDLIHEPGSAYRYTTFGFVLLQGVIEAASGQAFLTYLQSEILDPLQMSRTVPDQKDSVYQNRSLLYKKNKNGKVKESRFDDPSYKWGGGGMLSTVSDLVKLGEAHLADGLFTQQTLDSLFTPQVLMPRSETHIGLGWRIGEDANGDRIFHHAGNMNGARSLLVLYPDEQIVIAIQNNLSNMPRILTVASLVKEALFDMAEEESMDFLARMK